MLVMLGLRSQWHRWKQLVHRVSLVVVGSFCTQILTLATLSVDALSEKNVGGEKADGLRGLGGHGQL